MSDDTLVIGGGGSLAVATDDQIARAQRLESFTNTARTIIDQLRAITASLTEGELRAAGAPPSAFEAERELSVALALLDRVADQAQHTAALTRAAMIVYGQTERQIEDRLRDWSNFVATIDGAGAGGFFLTVGGLAVYLMGFISPDTQHTDPSGFLKFIADHPEMVNSAPFVEIVKLLVDAIGRGTFAIGFVSPQVSDLLEASGLSSTELAAAALIASGAATGKLRDSAATIKKLSSRTSAEAPPAGWADRIARIPDTDNNGGAQIRIDKYVDAKGNRRFEVYLSGTQTFSTSKTSTPFDMTSNMRGIAGQPNAALAAVEKAMKAAGVRSGDPVNVTGHSQGGLLAHEVAATGRWNVRVALEAGPPAASTPLPPGTTEVVLAHNEDVVTALGGSRTDDSAIVVHATAFPDGTIPKGESIPPAHDTARYEHTAHLLDGAASSMVNDAKDEANASEKGVSTSVTTTLYKAERVWNK